MKKEISVIIDISTKKWLNLNEAIAYLGYGSKGLFQEWRETGRLPYYKPGKNILYKRTDLDRFVESHRQGGFAQE
jgi:excisionase family DNA binding protein